MYWMYFDMTILLNIKRKCWDCNSLHFSVILVSVSTQHIDKQTILPMIPSEPPCQLMKSTWVMKLTSNQQSFLITEFWLYKPILNIHTQTLSQTPSLPLAIKSMSCCISLFNSLVWSLSFNILILPNLCLFADHLGYCLLLVCEYCLTLWVCLY